MKLVFACLGLALVPLASLRSSTLSPALAPSPSICDRCIYGHEGCTEHPKEGSVVAPHSIEKHQSNSAWTRELAEHAKAQAQHAKAQAEHARAQVEHTKAQAEHARAQAEAHAQAAKLRGLAGLTVARAPRAGRALNSGQIAEMSQLAERLAQLEVEIAGQGQSGGHSCHCGHTCCGSGPSSSRAPVAPLPPLPPAAPPANVSGLQFNSRARVAFKTGGNGEWEIVEPIQFDLDEDCDDEQAAECEEVAACEETAECEEEVECEEALESEADEAPQPDEEPLIRHLQGTLLHGEGQGQVSRRLQLNLRPAVLATSASPLPSGSSQAELRDLVREMRDEIQALREALRELRSDVQVSRDEMLR